MTAWLLDVVVEFDERRAVAFERDESGSGCPSANRHCESVLRGFHTMSTCACSSTAVQFRRAGVLLRGSKVTEIQAVTPTTAEALVEVRASVIPCHHEQQLPSIG